jgi:hypothetical protein
MWNLSKQHTSSSSLQARSSDPKNKWNLEAHLPITTTQVRVVTLTIQNPGSGRMASNLSKNPPSTTHVQRTHAHSVRHPSVAVSACLPFFSGLLLDSSEYYSEHYKSDQDNDTDHDDSMTRPTRRQSVNINEHALRMTLFRKEPRSGTACRSKHKMTTTMPAKKNPAGAVRSSHLLVSTHTSWHNTNGWEVPTPIQ